MKSYNNSETKGGGLKSLPLRLGLVTLMLGTGLALSTAANAATPLAGSLISNQASASYTDGSGAVKTSTSNAVITTVTQVAALDLVTDNTKTLPTSGGTAYLPHTLTNLGNGPDTFKLPLVENTAGPGTFSSIQIFLDADGNGVPDSATPLCGTGSAIPLCSNFTTPSLPVNGTFKFIVALQVPAGAAPGIFETATVTAISDLDITKTNIDTDTVNITAGAAFNVTKSISVPTGASSPLACTGTNYPLGLGCKTAIYTLTYTNTGAAGNLYLEDVIGAAATPTAGMEYIAGQSLWSSSATVLTEAVSGDVAGIEFQALDSTSAAITVSGAGTIKAVIANVGSGVSGTIKFKVGIKSTALLGNSSTTNTAKFDAVAGTTVPPTTPVTVTNTNPSDYIVIQNYAVVANDWVTDATDGDNATTNDGTNPRDVVLQPAAAPGTTVVFDNYIWNTGTGTDTFDIVLGAGNFPAGTLFQVFKSNGATALADSNGGGVPDTGPLAAGGSYKVVVKAIIPAAACSPTCPAGPFTVDITATSVGDNTKTNKVFDQLTALTAPTVDMTNTIAGVASDIGAATGLTTNNSIAAGASTSFNLFVKNSGSSADNYDLQYSNSNFVAGALPVGWSVIFRNTDNDTTSTAGTCTALTGSVITNTGSVPGSNGQVKVCAVVTTPANAAAGQTEIFFKVLSGATGASDVKHDAVTITPNAAMSLTPNGSGQVFPGGSVIYPHDLTNTGNLSCGVGGTANFTFNVSGVNTGWSIAIYADVNNSGTIDVGDTLVVSHNGTVQTAGTPLSGPLAIGAVRKLLAKVVAPAGAASGDTDNIVISVVDGGTVPCVAPPANDATLVVTGQVRLTKAQALDSTCDGAADGAFVSTNLTAKPGECLVYKIDAVNAGTTNVTAITISDSTPNFTSYQSGLTCSAGALTPAAPTAGFVGGLSCGPIATMIPGATETMQFVVKVNP